MKNQLTKFLFILIAIAIFKFAYDKYQTSKNSHFTVTADTVIKPGSEISKYVTQEEVDSFALRYWDIDEDAKYSNDNIDENITQKTLRSYLKAKDTNSLLNFIKDNNLSVDIRMMYNLTPLMYASFYDDEKTMEELLNLGANPNLKDSYNLSPLAYAIENNSTKTFKLLLDNGAIFDEDMIVQNYLNGPSYIWIKKIIIDGDNIKVEYRSEYGTKQGKGVDPASAITYMVDLRLVEILQTLFDSGYKIKSPIDKNCAKSFRDKFRCSYYYYLTTAPDYKKTLKILLDNNISMPVDDEFLKSEYGECYDEYRIFLNTQSDYDKGELQLKDYEISDLKRTLEYYSKNCNVKNSTFTIKTYIVWKNTSNKNWAIDKFLTKYRNDDTKVIYIDKNSSNCKSAIVEHNSSNLILK